MNNTQTTPNQTTPEREYTQRTKDYLAMVHLAGYPVSGLHKGSQHSTDVLLGFEYDVNTKRFELKPGVLDKLTGHPLILSMIRLRIEGWKVDRSKVVNYRRWTISKGVPVIHTDHGGTGVVYVDGRFRQYTGALGEWLNQGTTNPGVVDHDK